MSGEDKGSVTLIDVIVVVAVLIVAVAILTPYIRKHIDDSRRAEAYNEVRVIGRAVTTFYRDTGMWPSRSAAGQPVAVLYTGTSTPAAAAIFRANPPVVPPAVPWSGRMARLDDSLLTNGSGSAYPVTGDMMWRGPYATGALPADPWGRPYIVNVAATGPVWVLSAGSNGKVQTAPTDNVARGDDIGFRVQ